MGLIRVSDKHPTFEERASGRIPANKLHTDGAGNTPFFRFPFGKNKAKSHPSNTASGFKQPPPQSQQQKAQQEAMQRQAAQQQQAKQDRMLNIQQLFNMNPNFHYTRPNLQPTFDPNLTSEQQAQQRDMRGRFRYQENTLFYMDKQLMYSIGFTMDEIEALTDAVEYYGIVTGGRLKEPPFNISDPFTVNRIGYMYNICMGKTTIDTDDIYSLSRHFAKLSRGASNNRPFNPFLISNRRIKVVPRIAVVAGIPSGNFSRLNSSTERLADAIYPVSDIASNYVHIRSRKRMGVANVDRIRKISETEYEYGIPNMLYVTHIGNADKREPWAIKINKKYCRLCNRFIIVVSKSMQGIENSAHHGAYQLLTIEGHIIYLYAKTIDHDVNGNPRDTVASNETTFVLDYGFFDFEIIPKLQYALRQIASRYKIVFFNEIEKNYERYRVIPSYTGQQDPNMATDMAMTPTAGMGMAQQGQRTVDEDEYIEV